MFKKTLATAIILVCIKSASAQDSTKKPFPLAISGSVDAYYRYSFEDPKLGGTNNLTSFTNSKNSFELGMASLKLDHTAGKVSATADLGFGRRAAEFSYNDGTNSLAIVKQLYVSYAVSDKVKLTMGKWATHVGYELVDAVANRNYSMSYMFSYGPFFHTGLKADIGLGGKSALMVGVANPTDFSTTTSSTKVIIAQFSTATKNDKLKAYLNYQGGNSPAFKLNQVDLVLTATLSPKFNISYDGSVYSVKNEGSSTKSWFGSALYLNFDPTDKFGLTLRGEYFGDKKAVTTIATDVLAITLSGNIKLGPLTVVPEVRLDNGKLPMFQKNNGSSTKSASSAILAVVYKF
ncbi:MAG: porin [Chitinophagaceae bacterium]|nr:porin [Chitinophagaceae bacterium]